MLKIQKVLIANRGEIAVRVMRTCRDLGIQTVAVYSEPDRDSLHVRLADEAFLLGPAPSSESYLAQEKILEIADHVGADAIHPGYGFLAENAEFARRCEEAGFRFVGPPASAIAAMGDKTEARRLMERADVPMAPGSAPLSGPKEAVVASERIGFPVLVKAAAGGGGKGMRVVHRASEIEDAVAAAQRESKAAFGDDRVYLEKYIARPKHIEIQILADEHGNCIHLFERECSIQRRYQKVVEEAPSAIVDESMRMAMGDAAVRAALACGYANAGTVEFLVDEDRRYYFMEMNTRLQVEHPVTEAITGLDLVAEQLRIAAGHSLSLRQDEIQLTGHAIECRIYAEDPSRDFLPDAGRLVRHIRPSGPGVRVDEGVLDGQEILVHYDPLISKVITWAPDRERATKRMLRALSEYRIAGVATTIPFCRYVLQHEAFRDGTFSTHFVEDHFDQSDLSAVDEDSERVAAVAAVLYADQFFHGSSADGQTAAPGAESRWVRRRKPGNRRH